PFSVPNISVFATSSKFPSTFDGDKGRSAATHLAALTTGVAAVQRLRRARRGGKSTLNAEPDRGFRILEWASSAMGGQKSLVKVARWGSREAWRTMVKELAPQSPSGDYLRPASQLKAETGSKLTLIDGGHAVYVGNTCPWCHRIQLALVLRRVPENLVARVQMLDEPERASRGGWAFDPARGVSDPVFDAADLREVY
ncbi:unnamed protein product, partial [Polarella glacialis]